jgi:hypothetical protein
MKLNYFAALSPFLCASPFTQSGIVAGISGVAPNPIEAMVPNAKTITDSAPQGRRLSLCD